MARRAVFAAEQVPGLRGLASLTEPDAEEPVDAVIDLAVIGARGDGKTQLIVQAIRTLRAYAPELSGAEQQHHRDIMRVVLDARAPRPEATPPGVVPHYVFRIRAPALLGGLGAAARLRLLAATTHLGGAAMLALGAGAGLGAALGGLGAPVDAALLAGAGLTAAAGALAARGAARRFARGGEIEIVFWDIAGEHVFSSSCADYHALLDALVRQRRRGPARRYAFAPVLLCNPLGLGVEREGSAYHRLRQIAPMFAALDSPARLLVAVNRWSLVEALCPPDAERDETVAVFEPGRGGVDPDPGAAPRLCRDVVRAWCRDAEDGRDDDVAVTHLRYDAGTRCQVQRLPEGAGGDGATAAVEYRWEEGPGALAGPARRTFLGWLAALAYQPARPVAAATASVLDDEPPPLPALAPLGQHGLPALAPARPEVWSRGGVPER
jgi:hypothetical protein